MVAPFQLRLTVDLAQISIVSAGKRDQRPRPRFQGHPAAHMGRSQREGCDRGGAWVVDHTPVRPSRTFDATKPSPEAAAAVLRDRCTKG
ncbi:MAG: hypothetical protein ACYDHB_11545 [Candidatus Dormibacteria bacterium]